MKNNSHFRIPHPQISLKEFSNICENVVYFFYYVGGGKMIKDFGKKKYKKKLNMVSLVFFDILQLPHTVILNSEKLTPPTVQWVQ